MSVSGVKEHLEILEKVGLIEKMDDGHKWKYYELTRKGSDIVAPRELRVWILLSISMIALAGSMLALFSPPAAMPAGGAAPVVDDTANAQPDVQADASMKAVAYGAGEAAPPEADRAMDNGSLALTAGAPLQASAESNESGAGNREEEVPKPETQDTKPDLTLPLAVAAVSALTLLLCAGVLLRNRMKPASLG
jgi:hypothetical protein